MHQSGYQSVSFDDFWKMMRGRSFDTVADPQLYVANMLAKQQKTIKEPAKSAPQVRTMNKHR